MHGEITSFYVESNPAGPPTHVVMTVTGPDEGSTVTIRASQRDLAAMAGAEPRRDSGPRHVATQYS